MQATLGQLYQKERQRLAEFFGRAFKEEWIEKFARSIEKFGQAEVGYWESLGLVPRYLPPVTMDRDFPGWRFRTNPTFPKAVAGGGVLLRDGPKRFLIDRRALSLRGATVLIDVRLKPDISGGSQAFEDDGLIGPIVTSLRREKIIRLYPQAEDSRFGISPDEWENHIRPMLADKLDLPAAQVRLERVIEANVIPQLFPELPRAQDAETDSWLWFEEYFRSGQNRICGLASVLGGYKHIAWTSVRNGVNFIGIRPIAVLD